MHIKPRPLAFTVLNIKHIDLGSELSSQPSPLGLPLFGGQESKQLCWRDAGFRPHHAAYLSGHLPMSLSHVHTFPRMGASQVLGRGRKETLKGTLCCSACLSPQPLLRSVLLLPEEEMSFHSPSGLCCYLFPSSVPNSPMNFSERPQLVCQGPGTNIKTTKGGKNPRTPWVSFL